MRRCCGARTACASPRRCAATRGGTRPRSPRCRGPSRVPCPPFPARVGWHEAGKGGGIHSIPGIPGFCRRSTPSEKMGISPKRHGPVKASLYRATRPPRRCRRGTRGSPAGPVPRRPRCGCQFYRMKLCTFSAFQLLSFSAFQLFSVPAAFQLSSFSAIQLCSDSAFPVFPLFPLFPTVHVFPPFPLFPPCHSSSD